MEKASRSGMPYRALEEVWERGMAAWLNNPLSVRLKSTGEKNVAAPRSQKIGQFQWAMARVNAFINRKKSVFYGADNDIRKKYHLE